MSDLVELIEEARNRTWGDDSRIPIGPSISSSFHWSGTKEDHAPVEESIIRLDHLLFDGNEQPRESIRLEEWMEAPLPLCDPDDPERYVQDEDNT